MKHLSLLPACAALALLLMGSSAHGAVQSLPTQHLLVITQEGAATSPGAMELRRILATKYGYREQEVRLAEVSTSAIISELFRALSDVSYRDEIIIYWKLPVRRDPAYSRAADDLGLFIGNELPNLLRKLSEGPKLVVLDSCDLEGWSSHRQQSKYANAAQFSPRGSELFLGVCSEQNPRPPLSFLAHRLADSDKPFNVLDLIEPLLEMDPPAVVIGELPPFRTALELRPAGEDTLARLAGVIRGEATSAVKTNAMDELVVAAVSPEQIRRSATLLGEVAAAEQQPAEVRRHALGRLQKLGFSQTPEPLRRYLSTEVAGADEILRVDAVKLIDAVRPADALEIFATMALHQKPPAATAATQAVASLPGTEPARILAEILQAERGEEIHIAALDGVSLLKERTPELRDGVLRRLGDRDDDVRAAAVPALASFADAAAMDAIVAAAGDSDTTVRYQVAFALARLERAKPGHPAMVPTLDKLSHDSNARVREASLMGLVRLANRRGAPRVLEMLTDRDEDVRVAAINAATELNLPESGPRIRALLRDEHVVVRSAAANALRLLNDRDSVPALEALLAVEQEYVTRDLAQLALNTLRGACSNIEAPELRAGKARPAERARAIHAICPADYVRALPLLKELLSDADFDVRAAAADVLAKYPARQLRNLAQDILANGSSLERIGIARALGRTPETFGTELLAGIDDQSADVRLAMIAALGQRTDERAQAILKGWTGHAEDTVRLAVAKSLRDQSEKLFAEQKYSQALDGAMAALDTRRRRRESAQDVEIATDLNNIGVMYLALNNLDQATNFLNQARARREALSARDPDLAVVWLNLAAVASERKEWKDAEAAYLRALSVRESTLPAADPLISETYSLIIDFYEQQGRQPDARRYRDLQRKRAMSAATR